jgi:signal transduction histidine kinase
MPNQVFVLLTLIEFLIIIKLSLKNKKLDAQIQQLIDDSKQTEFKLRKLDQLKDDFVSMASHELRTPMTAIKSFLWMVLVGKAGPISDKLKHYIQRSFDSTERLIKLINDMLDVSKIESGRVLLELQKVDLIELVDDVVETMTPRAKELNISLKIDKDTIKNQKNLWVVADPDKVKEVLFNFIGNSLKFTPEKGDVNIGFNLDKTHITIYVKDTGVGLSEGNHDHLFEKFVLLKGSYRVNHDGDQGTGLGLYICKSIVKLHQGRIWAHSDGVDKGSTFYFTLLPFSEQKLQEMKEYGKRLYAD